MEEKKQLFMPMNIFRKVAKMGENENLTFFRKSANKTPIAFTTMGTVFCSQNYSEKKDTFIMVHQGGNHKGVDKSHLLGSLWAVNSDLKLVIPSEHLKVEKPKATKEPKNP
jgi:hypothetical protein